MKTILNLKQYVVLLIAAFAMTSCLDSEDDDFQIVAGGGYIVQINSSSSSSFFPMVTAYANEAMSGGCKISNGKVDVSLKDIDGAAKMGVQTNASTQSMLATELTNVTGQYTITAINAAQETATNWFSLSASKGMGILKGGIENSNGSITAYFNIVDNADYYYVFLQKDNYGSILRSKYWSETELKKADLVADGEYEGCYKVTFSVNDLIGTSTELTAGRYILVSAAAITQSSYGDILVLQEGAQTSYVKE